MSSVGIPVVVSNAHMNVLHLLRFMWPEATLYFHYRGDWNPIQQKILGRLACDHPQSRMTFLQEPEHTFSGDCDGMFMLNRNLAAAYNSV